MNVLIIVTALLIKHFICDFILQTSSQYKQKANYGQMGGIIHSGLHLVGTFVVFYFVVTFEMALLFAVIDGVVHYHVDWAKANLNRHFKLYPNENGWYWVLFGLDQLTHQITYVILVYWSI